MNNASKIAASHAITGVLVAFLSIAFPCYGKKHKNEPANNVVQAPREIPLSTPKGTITLIYSDLTNDGFGGGRLQPVKLHASLRNDTSVTFSSLEVVLYGHDSNSADLWLCGTPGISEDGGCSFYLFGQIQPGQTLPITSPGDFTVIDTTRNVARGEWKVGKRSSYFIKYDIQADPITNEKFTILPTFSLKGMGLEFRNTSPDVIEVAWDQSVYIDEDGNSSRLIRGNVSLAEKDRPQPNTIIPPGTKLQETVFPVDHVKQSDGKWSQEPLLPSQLSVRAPSAKPLTGKELKLFLRLLVNDQKQNVTLTFKIANMIQ
jgi:hypothetical protein